MAFNLHFKSMMIASIKKFVALSFGCAGLFLFLGAPACPSTSSRPAATGSTEVKAGEAAVLPEKGGVVEVPAVVGGFDAGNPEATTGGVFDAGNAGLTVSVITGKFKKSDDGKCPVDHVVYVKGDYSHEDGEVIDCGFKKEISADATTLGIAAVGAGNDSEWSVFDFGKNQDAVTITNVVSATDKVLTVDLGKDILYKPFEPAVPTNVVTVPEGSFGPNPFGFYKPGLIENRNIGALKPCPANHEGVKIELKSWTPPAGKPGSAVNEVPMPNGVELDIYSQKIVSRSGKTAEEKAVFKGKMEAGFARTFGLATIDAVPYTVECRSRVTNKGDAEPHALLLRTACYYNEQGPTDGSGKSGACYYWEFTKN